MSTRIMTTGLAALVLSFATITSSLGQTAAPGAAPKSAAPKAAAPTAGPSTAGNTVKTETAQHPRLAKAIRELEDAIKYLEAAPHNFGGHKAKGIADSKAAIAELRQAMAYRAVVDNTAGKAPAAAAPKAAAAPRAPAQAPAKAQ